MLDLDLSRLRIFVAVAHTGSLTRGAAALRMQQPTVSRSIALLEKELGVALFERRARGVALTEKGQRLLDATQPLIDDLERSIAGALAEPEAPGILPIGAAEVVANTILPRVHSDMARSLPNLAPYVLVAPADVLADRVQSGALSFALVMHVKRRAGLGVRTLDGLRHHLVVARAHARDKRVLARFIGSREVEDPGNRQFPTLEKLKAIAPDAHISASSNSLTLHKAMALAGLGVAILPELMVRAELESGELVSVLGDELSFPLLCLSRTGAAWSAAAKAYIGAVEAALKAL